MNIFYTIDSHPENGGAPISTCNIAAGIGKIYGTSTLIYPSQTREFELPSNINKIMLETVDGRFPLFVFKPFKVLRLTYSLGKIIKNMKPDIVHAQMPRTAWAVGLLKALKFIPKDIICIYTDRDHVKSYRLIFRIVSFLLIKCIFNEVVCLTEISASYWKNQEGKAFISVIPNSAGEIYESYNKLMHQKMREKYNVSQNKFTVMFSGRMSIYKNWDLAKEVISSLKYDGFLFVFAISTMNKEQEERFFKFKRDIEKLGIDYLLFHNAGQTEMEKYYYLADIFVMTSNRESFGRTAIEAMSRKCVVIGRDVGGLPEVIGKEENILGCNVQEFTSLIRYYKENPSQMNVDKEWFYSRFITNYTNKVNIERHQKMYDFK